MFMRGPERPVLRMHITKAGVRDVARDAFTELPWLLGDLLLLLAHACRSGMRPKHHNSREHPSYCQTDEVFAFRILNLQYRQCDIGNHDITRFYHTVNTY